MTRAQSFVGHNRFSDGYPDLRWASQGGINAARLIVGADEVVLEPLKVVRKVLGMPTVRIPVAAIESVWGISWGVKFNTPSRPDLDGTVFKANTATGGRDLKAAIEALGIPVVEMPVGARVAGYFRAWRAQRAAGKRWLRHGWSRLRNRVTH